MPYFKTKLPILVSNNRHASKLLPFFRTSLTFSLFSACLLLYSQSQSTAAPSAPPHLSIGAARVDITPDFPVRLSGYSSRTTEDTKVALKLWARALVIGDQQPVVMVTVDSIAVPASIAEAAAKQLEKKFGISRARLVLAGTHSHNAPHPARDYLPCIFRTPLSEDEWKSVDRYGQQMLQGIVTAVTQAMQKRKPCLLSWAQGSAGFAHNRRTVKGVASTQVDHSLPLLAARDQQGDVVATLVNYACHCTTLGAGYSISGDWAGYASESLEKDHPNAVALVMIGCGADANPKGRGGKQPKVPLAQKHGAEIANEVNRLLGGKMKNLNLVPEAKFQFVELPLEAAPSRDEIEKAALNNKKIHNQQLAQALLKKMDAGIAPASSVKLPVQSWRFGDDLGMIFLGGEVVVDYSLKLKQLYGSERLWISAYCNDTPCYIPSKRILNEGGYEADFSMVFYGKPARFKPEVEPLLLKTITGLLPTHWLQTNK